MSNDQIIQSIVDQYDAFLPDNDGTCFRTEELHAEVGSAILRANGVPDMTYTERFNLMGRGEHGIWEHLHAQGRTPTISKDVFKKMQGELFTQALPTIAKEKLWRPGMLDLIQGFHKAGKPVIVVSNTARDVVEALHKIGGGRRYITEIIALEDIMAAGKARKPAADAYLMAVERVKALLGKTDVRSLGAEDSDIGLQALLAAGQVEEIDAIHIYYAGVEQKPNALARYTIADHLDLTDAFRNLAPVEVVVAASSAQPAAPSKHTPS